MSRSLAEHVALLDPDERAEALRGFDMEALEWDFNFWGRPEQIYRPGPEAHTVACAGRGWGKNEMGSHAAHFVAMNPEFCGGRPAEGPDDRRAGEGAGMAIIGRTANETNNQMIDGDSGIMAAAPPELRPKWNKQAMTLTWPTGVVCRVFSADVPLSGRGPNTGWFWADEIAFWRRLREMWKLFKLTHRKAAIGQHPRALITTTPQGVLELLKIMFVMDGNQPMVAPPGTPPERIHQGWLVHPAARIIGGSSYENKAHLAPEFLRDTVGQLEGTPDGDEEIHAKIRLGVPGAPWKREDFTRCEPDDVPRLDQVIIAVDPTVSDNEQPKGQDEPCECGIMAMGFHRRTRRVFKLRDESLVARPSRWAERVVDAAIRFDAREIVVEDNNGGQLLRNEVTRALERRRAQIKGRWPKVVLVKATRSKYERACLAAPMWADGAVVHVGAPMRTAGGGTQPSPRHWVPCEGQMTQLDPNKPYRSQRTDRIDASVWGVLHFLGDGTDRTRPWSKTKTEAWKAAARGAGR